MRKCRFPSDYNLVGAGGIEPSTHRVKVVLYHELRAFDSMLERATHVQLGY